MNNQALDNSVIERKLSSLVSRLQKEIKMKALNAGAKEMQKYTRQSLISKFPKAKTAKGKSKKTMYDEIHIIVDKQNQLSLVSVMNYLTKWFEMGTMQRFTKEDHPADEKHRRTYRKYENRGEIKPLHYFRDAREQHNDDVVDVISQIVIKELQNDFNE